MIKNGQLISGLQTQHLVLATALPATAYAAVNSPFSKATVSPDITRRAVLSLGASAVAFTVFTPQKVMADNTNFINTVAKSAASYCTNQAPEVIRAVAKG